MAESGVKSKLGQRSWPAAGRRPGWALLAVLVMGGCGTARILPPVSPFPPVSRWELPLAAPLASPLATDGNLVFAVSSTGILTAIDPVTGRTVWIRAAMNPGFVAARSGFLVFVEKGGLVWGLNPADGNGEWKTATRVQDVQSVRLDGNRIFVGGASGIAALVVSTGERRFDLPAKDVRDIDAAGDWVAALEEGSLQVRRREDGGIRFRLQSPEGAFGAPAVFPDGRMVVGSGDRLVRAISPEGKFTWRFRVGARMKDRPLDYLDGRRVGVASFEGVFYELSLRGGDMKNRVLLPSRPYGAPVLRAGRIFVPVFEDEIVVIDVGTTKLFGRARYGGGFLTPPILAQGRLVAEITGPRRIVALEMAPER